MEFFKRAKVFRLKRSSKSKYLIAHKDEETIKQSRDNSSDKARWCYELVEGKPNVIRLRSCSSWRYLTTTEDPFLLGMTGKKVIQTINQGPTTEWEPIKEGLYIKLKSHTGSTLKANRGPPPWRNSVTHDEPGHWTSTEYMTLWIVDLVEIDYQSSKKGDTDSISTEEIKRINVVSVSCNVADQEVKMSAKDKSDSAIKLKSNLDDTLNINKVNGTHTDRVSEYSVQRANKQTFDQLKIKDFHTILSLGRDNELEKAVNVLIIDAKSKGRGKVPSKLVEVQEKLKSMKKNHESASKNSVEYSKFSTRRSEIRDKLKKDAAQARELETVEINLSNTILEAKAKKEELLKQLEKTESAIKDVEKARSGNMAIVEELISRIEKKSKGFKEMESKEKSWRMRKNEAERMLQRIEKDWEIVKSRFPHI
ncbi:uncharacterized protein LOC104884564 [Beta vulgaris subsp. vulgaris]|uniref:uncharacterized protein LOC104884564 n=1 Tax=Beta vulgaris subsp. vulgaris TaxID=3555 RepID=UPI00053F55FE|nr:uncharacterized protein LOC104884564 [Beta vulgaris subsp. vulgaris]